MGSQMLVDEKLIKDMQIENRHESPSLNRYPDRNSLPYSTSLRQLANRSVSGLQSNAGSPRLLDFEIANPKPSLHMLGNSAIL